MKKLLVLFGLMLMLSYVYGAFINPNEAYQIGMDFYSNLRGGLATSCEIQARSSSVAGSDDKPVYYILKFRPSGYLILAAEEQSIPILAYDLESEYPSIDPPPNVQWLLDLYANGIEEIRQHPEWAQNEDWTKIRNGDFSAYGFVQSRDVSHLLDTSWGQGTYYNAQCPADPAGPGGHAVAGCEAIAMAQVMRYWEQPYKGNGSHSYVSD